MLVFITSMAPLFGSLVTTSICRSKHWDWNCKRRSTTQIKPEPHQNWWQFFDFKSASSV